MLVSGNGIPVSLNRATSRSQRVAERLGCTPGETVTLFDTGSAVVWEHPR